MTVENNNKATGGVTGKGFEPGKSGNPGGRPKIAQEFKDKCREFMSEDGWEKLKLLATNGRSKDHMKALELIAAYAYGKPKQGIELTGEEGNDINITIKRV
jgi:hypothetical protein